MRIVKLAMTTLVLTALLSSCGTIKKKSSTNNPSKKYSSSEIKVNGDSDSYDAAGLRTVHFPFNSAQLRNSTREILENNAEFLRVNSNVKIQVEGHCDERGSVQYNLALGERRSQSVKDYLVASGVAPHRVTTISYGKERPVAIGHDEVSWSKNRRGNFVIIAK